MVGSTPTGATIMIPHLLFLIGCVAIPVVGFGRVAVQNWDVVQWIHAPKYYEAKMAAKKKKAETWRMKDGKEIVLSAMEDLHLENAIQMVARNSHKPLRVELQSDKSWKKLVGEAKRRKWKVSLLPTPIDNNGRKEYVDVWKPTPRSQMSIAMHIPEWDSRMDE